jgi:hypothetical protein
MAKKITFNKKAAFAITHTPIHPPLIEKSVCHFYVS